MLARSFSLCYIYAQKILQLTVNKDLTHQILTDVDFKKHK